MARKRRRNWDSLLQGTTSPCFMIDIKRCLVFFNAGCEELFGWSAEEVCGQICMYVSEPDPDKTESVTSTLCPPEEVWQGQHRTVAAYIQNRNGTVASRLVQFVPLFDEEELCQAVMGLLLPLEEHVSTNNNSLPHSVHTELAALRISLRQQYGFDRVVAHTDQMRRVLSQARMAVEQEEPVCLMGESGVGKEYLARVIHHADNPQGRAFVPLDCKKLSTRQLKFDLLELFDEEEQGSLPTGLQSGTIYLKRAELLPRDLQQWLLEQLQFRRQSSSHHLRLMLGVHDSPDRLLASETFLPEFYYICTSIEIKLPALRDRLDDLPLLAQYFLEEENRHTQQQFSDFQPEVWTQLKQYQWPGNLSELRETVQQACQNCEGVEISPEDLPFGFRTGLHVQTLVPHRHQVEPLEQALHRIEKELILEAFQQAGRNKTKTAKLLGLTRPKLYRRMESLGVSLDEEEIQD